MHPTRTLERVCDLCDPAANILYGMDIDQARRVVAGGRPEEVAQIDGHFALVGREGTTVRMARSIGRIMRYFIAKRADGPALIVADRIDRIHEWLRAEGLADQFHPSYTRMVPAHHVVEIRLLGCPDPNPTYHRFFDPPREVLPADVDLIADKYVGALHHEIARLLIRIPTHEPIGVCFSGGIDSGAVFLLTYHAMLNAGLSPSRLKAFTLSVDGEGSDLQQAREFLDRLDLGLFLEPINVPASAIDVAEAIRVVEDYKPLDVQAAAVNLALLRGIRRRYADWIYLLDGDGGDENLKDYPIEENSELTIRSVLNNRMLYQEGWGVDSIKHSLTYSGGQSRGYVRAYAPARAMSFMSISPYVARPVIEAAEGIPFAELSGGSHERLYALKGRIVSRGVERLTGMKMPVFEKCRFQHGAMHRRRVADLFPTDERAYRRIFHSTYA